MPPKGTQKDIVAQFYELVDQYARRPADGLKTVKKRLNKDPKSVVLQLAEVHFTMLTGRYEETLKLCESRFASAADLPPEIIDIVQSHVKDCETKGNAFFDSGGQAPKWICDLWKNACKSLKPEAANNVQKLILSGVWRDSYWNLGQQVFMDLQRSNAKSDVYHFSWIAFAHLSSLRKNLTDKERTTLQNLTLMFLRKAVTNTVEDKTGPKITTIRQLRLLCRIYQDGGISQDLIAVLENPVMLKALPAIDNDDEFIRYRLLAYRRLEQWKKMYEFCYSNLREAVSARMDNRESDKELLIDELALWEGLVKCHRQQPESSHDFDALIKDLEAVHPVGYKWLSDPPLDSLEDSTQALSISDLQRISDFTEQENAVIDTNFIARYYGVDFIGHRWVLYCSEARDGKDSPHKRHQGRLVGAAIVAEFVRRVFPTRQDIQFMTTIVQQHLGLTSLAARAFEATKLKGIQELTLSWAMHGHLAVRHPFPIDSKLFKPAIKDEKSSLRRVVKASDKAMIELEDCLEFSPSHFAFDLVGRAWKFRRAVISSPAGNSSRFELRRLSRLTNDGDATIDFLAANRYNLDNYDHDEMDVYSEQYRKSFFVPLLCRIPRAFESQPIWFAEDQSVPAQLLYLAQVMHIDAVVTMLGTKVTLSRDLMDTYGASCQTLAEQVISATGPESPWVQLGHIAIMLFCGKTFSSSSNVKPIKTAEIDARLEDLLVWLNEHKFSIPSTTSDYGLAGQFPEADDYENMWQRLEYFRALEYLCNGHRSQFKTWKLKNETIKELQLYAISETKAIQDYAASWKKMLQEKGKGHFLEVIDNDEIAGGKRLSAMLGKMMEVQGVDIENIIGDMVESATESLSGVGKFELNFS